MHISPHALSLTVAATAIAERRFAARALADAELACIDATDSQIDAWATLDRARARAEADRCDASSPSGLLAGIGIGVKDIIATRKLPTPVIYLEAALGHKAAVKREIEDDSARLFAFEEPPAELRAVRVVS